MTMCGLPGLPTWASVLCNRAEQGSSPIPPTSFSASVSHFLEGLAELADEQWILTEPGTWNYTVVAEAFQARGLGLPRIGVKTLSIHVRANLLADGPFISVFPRSVLHTYGPRFSLKALPVDLPLRPWPVTIVTLKHRTLSPVVERFIGCAREVARTFTGRRQAGRT